MVMPSVRLEEAFMSPNKHCDTFCSCSQEGVSREVLQAIPAQLLLFHSPILKPDFNLAVGEVQHSGQLKPFLFVDVNVEEEFPLQLSNLKLGVWTPLLPCARSAWRPNEKWFILKYKYLPECHARDQTCDNIRWIYSNNNKCHIGQKRFGAGEASELCFSGISNETISVNIHPAVVAQLRLSDKPAIKSVK